MGQTVLDVINDCVHTGRPEAWAEFIARFHPLITSAVVRTVSRWGNARSGLVEDLIQDTYLKLCGGKGRILREFDPRHEAAIYGYVKAIATNLVIDHFKRQHAMKRLPAQPARHPSRDYSRDLEFEVLTNQIDRMLREHRGARISDRDVWIFWLYFRHGLTARAIAALPRTGLTEKGVESTLARLARIVRGYVGTDRPARQTGARSNRNNNKKQKTRRRKGSDENAACFGNGRHDRGREPCLVRTA